MPLEGQPYMRAQVEPSLIDAAPTAHPLVADVLILVRPQIDASESAAGRHRVWISRPFPQTYPQVDAPVVDI